MRFGPKRGTTKAFDRALSKPREKTKRLTEDEWRQVFKARCRSKQGQGLTPEERALIDRAWNEDKKRYEGMEAEVFDATVPFGSSARFGDMKRRK